MNSDLELADLQTVFHYLDSGNTIKQMRCVLFQAKMKSAAGDYQGLPDMHMGLN